MSRDLGRSVARNADRIARCIEKSAALVESLGADTSGPSHQAVRVARQGLFAFGTPPPRELVTGMPSMVEAVYARKLWQRSSHNVLAVHPDFAADLARARRGSISWQVFDQLAHSNPRVVFGEPVPVPAPDEPCRLLGIQAYASDVSEGGSRVLVDTREGGSWLSLLLFIEGPHGVSLVGVDLPRTGQRSVAEVFADMRSRGVSIHGDEETYQWLAAVAVHTMMYLCCSERDESHQGAVLDDDFASENSRGGSGGTGVKVPVLGLGYHLAADLHPGEPLSRTTRVQASEATPRTGRHKRPHERSAHYRFHRHGPGWSLVKLIRIAAFPVGHGPESETTPIRLARDTATGDG